MGKNRKQNKEVKSFVKSLTFQNADVSIKCSWLK